MTVDVFGPVFAVFIAVDEAGVGFGLDDEDGVGGNDYVVDFGGVSPITEEQAVDDFVFAVGRRRRMEATCFSPRRPFGISRRQRKRSRIATTMTMMQTSSEVPFMFIFGYKSLMECFLMISLKLNVLQIY